MATLADLTHEKDLERALRGGRMELHDNPAAHAAFGCTGAIREMGTAHRFAEVPECDYSVVETLRSKQGVR
jgi:hypothetical protein